MKERIKNPIYSQTTIVVEKHYTRESPFRGGLLKRHVYHKQILFLNHEALCMLLYKPWRVDARESIATDHQESLPISPS
jgi:hypothetical protein